jgi:catechol 2,3-dioxygenase-like lactoylglutathione lyase family enzyme
MKLEVVVIPVSDVDRSKEFYERIGWRLNIDRSADEDFRLVQFTPPGSCCSVHFGKNVTSAAPGSAKSFLIVTDLVAARDQLVAAGVEVGEFFHDGPEGRGSGLHPERLSYRSRALFSIPTATAGTCRRSRSGTDRCKRFTRGCDTLTRVAQSICALFNGLANRCDSKAARVSMTRTFSWPILSPSASCGRRSAGVRR